MNRRLAFTIGFLALTVVAVLIVVQVRSPNAVDPKSGTNVKSPIKSDEQIIFYPTFAISRGEVEVPDYEIEIHGCVFEAGDHSAGVKLIRRLTGIDDSNLSSDEAKLFQQRAELFAVDHERGKAIPIRIGDKIHSMPKTEANGHFQRELILSDRDVRAALDRATGEFRFQAVLREGDPRTMGGVVHFRDRSPLHVVSDIDDTIKILHVRNKPELLMNTFCRPFRPVPGMAELYRSWDSFRVCFHYVSASPWQLYPPLAEFIRDHKFPAGSFHMKLFRPTDRSALNLLGSQIDYKRGEITSLLEKFPRDRFVLVGDSGEQDATIYAGIAREYPQQVSRILIRNVTDDSLDTFREVFNGLPEDLWQVFREPTEITFQPKSEK